ncbi:MAG: alpha/beta hydrolase [Flavobacteriales bacterium]|jgi:pimeloyl-ACP methyl ester carboxylesterase|nr:alpha/beta hydrolase [Flavobacteriales bacterium]
MKSLYQSEAGKNAILSLYDEKLKELGIDYKETIIETQFGKTNIIITGNESKPPLMILHGSNGCAPIGLETYPNLSKHYCVYAIDVLAQPNKSAETRLSMKNNDYGIWVNELITKLKLDQVILAGFSFGGLIILKTLIHDESRIKKVFLAAPAYIVNGNPLKALFKIFIPMKRYMKKGNQKYLEQFLNELFSMKDPFALKFLAQVFQHFEMDFTPVPVISKNEAQKIKTPIVLIGAQKDLMFPGEKMIKRAKKIFPSLEHTVLLEHSKHVQNRIDNNKIESLIIN